MGRRILVSLVALSASGCASIDFNAGGDDGLRYFEPKPMMLVTDKEDCSQIVEPIVIHGEARRLVFKPGYGSSSFTIKLTNGMISESGQTSDYKFADLYKAVFPSSATGSPKKCKAQKRLFAYAADGTISPAPFFTVPIPEIEP